MIRYKHALHLVLLLSLCSCSGGGGSSYGGVSITTTAPGVIQGADTNVPWTLMGVGFQNGATVTTNNVEVTIANTVVVSDTQITFDLTATNLVVAGTTLVTVMNPDLTTGATSVPAVPEIVMLSSEVQPIFDLSCATVLCHDNVAPTAGLDLSDGNSHTAIFNVPSTQPGVGMVLVLPADPDLSYVVDKIEGTQTFGVRMPAVGAPLSALNVQLVRKWIEAGALDN